MTPFPSDSFPGMVGQVTGGDPGVTGVYYDDTWNHAVFPAGTTNCSGPPPGGEVSYIEAADINQLSIDAGQGLTGLPGSILQMTSNPLTVINPAALPVNPATCKPIIPSQYLKVNTIFEVAREHGLRTAWSDKHPAYEILSGPSGTGVQDFFTPEINSDANGFPAGNDWTTDNAATMQYDSYKVQAVLNEIDGFDHSRNAPRGRARHLRDELPDRIDSGEAADLGRADRRLPAGRHGSRAAADARARTTSTPRSARWSPSIRAEGLAGSTALIISAKHGQSPTDPNALARVDDGPIIDGINAAWKAAHPSAGNLVAFAVDDDGMLMWLSDTSQAACDFAKHYLLTHSAAGNNISGNPITVSPPA